MWRRRKFRRLLNLIDHLPRNSYFVEALLDDEEFGEQVAAMPQEAPRERVSEWSPERVALAKLTDAVRALHATLIGLFSENPPRFEPEDRPVTAVQRARDNRARRAHRERVRSLGLGVVPDLEG